MTLTRGPIHRLIRLTMLIPGLCGVALTLAACVPPEPTDPVQPAPDPAVEPLPPSVELPAEVKRADFRLTPPEVEQMSLKKHGQGTSLLVVRFAEDTRLKTSVTLRPDGRETVLNDEGRDGDETARDGRFSAIIDLDADAVAAQQAQALEQLKKAQLPAVISRFEGRLKIGEERLTLPGNTAELFDLPGGGIAGLVNEGRSLAITDLTVVEDPSRTFNSCEDEGTPMGKWTFGYLMEQMANEPVTGIHPSDFTRRWLHQWEVSQTVNFFNVPARPAISNHLANWPKLADGRLNLAQAPFKLLAIINRIDLADNVTYGAGSGGEGRFVFGLMDTQDGQCTPTRFLVILEYGIPRHTCSEIGEWARLWMELGTFTPGTPDYNSRLESITEQFARANADPSKPNGSAINQIRTNENDLNRLWELREFRIFDTDSDAGQLRMVTVKQTPDRNGYNEGGLREDLLASWVNANEADILVDRHTVPLTLPAPSLLEFLGGNSPNNIDFWSATNITNNDARFHFSLNTCNGCHGRETDTTFTHVKEAPFGSEAALSAFMTGTSTPHVTDPMDSAVHHAFNDLEMRAGVLELFANRDCRLRIPFIPPLMVH